MKKADADMNVMASDAGTDSQMPYLPHIAGNRVKQMAVKTYPRSMVMHIAGMSLSML